MIGRCTDSEFRAADAMFGEVVAMLERKGAFDNAIVVILSDHGEALALTGRHDDQQ
jgi:arylsulfatase A-like enzyme